VDKRFVNFLMMASMILLTSMLMQKYFFPAPEQPLEIVEGNEPVEPEDPANPADPSDPSDPNAGDPNDPNNGETDPLTVRPVVENERVVLGSMASGNGYPFTLVFNNQGGSLEHVALTERKSNGDYRYTEIKDLSRGYDYRSGYLGYLAISANETPDGCIVNTLIPGSPAALAAGSGKSLAIGDRIVSVAGEPVLDETELLAAIESTSPGDTLEFEVIRGTTTLKLSTTLSQHPLAMIRPEQPDHLSYVLSLAKASDVKDGKIAGDYLKKMLTDNWEVRSATETSVEFAYPLNAQQLQQLGIKGDFEVIKRFSLVAAAEESEDSAEATNYMVDYQIELKNLSQTPATVAFRQDGANGLPLEGWWYSNKTHPKMFASAGPRDVCWKATGLSHELQGLQAIVGKVKEDPEVALDPLLDTATGVKPLDYVGNDTQYFLATMMPVEEQQTDFSAVVAYLLYDGKLTELDKTNIKLVNTSYFVLSKVIEVGGESSVKQDYQLFIGPKRPQLLADYGLGDTIIYGWFGFVSTKLSWVLHLCYGLIGNYGIAIILLTVLVRALMLPVSRQAAKNAQMMQALAPEMKKIQEKYKKDMEKKAAAQKELFAKHNYNPLSGCLLMFLQLPIFLGLYRCLAVDVELRQASFIPGLQWCSNLAGPDMMWYWQPAVWEIVGHPSKGYLGPYLNVLPLITIVLFMMHQKLFMPPPQDEQQKMQQGMMKYMMIFMGFLFFKVPAGLCIYFIISSLWGVVERKALPQPKIAMNTGGSSDKPAPAKKAPSGKGSGNKNSQKNSKKSRKK
jgi:YidC/Oxa1 family membrane protein insertase